MFGWLKKKKTEEIAHINNSVPEEITKFVADVHDVIEKYSSVEVMMIGESISNNCTVQVWYRFHSPHGYDTYPIMDYRAKVLSKIEINNFATFKIMYQGFDSDGDYASFEKSFNGEKAAKALSFFCSEVDKQRKHEQLFFSEESVIQ